MSKPVVVPVDGVDSDLAFACVVDGEGKRAAAAAYFDDYVVEFVRALRGIGEFISRGLGGIYGLPISLSLRARKDLIFPLYLLLSALIQLSLSCHRRLLDSPL